MEEPVQAKRRRQSRTEILSHLAEQIDFLRASASRFDSGHRAEAKRLATHLRVLLRDGGRSKALLSQLGGEFRWRLVDSVAIPVESISASGPYHGLIAIRLEKNSAGGRVTYDPLLVPERAKVPPARLQFYEWWNRMVMRDAGGLTFSRGDLVLAVADQDGGAHVDPALDEHYARLTRDHSLGYTFAVAGAEPREWTEDPVPPSIRQIAQEVLWTLEEQRLIAQRNGE